jgi:hypothetical protein
MAAPHDAKRKQNCSGKQPDTGDNQGLFFITSAHLTPQVKPNQTVISFSVHQSATRYVLDKTRNIVINLTIGSKSNDYWHYLTPALNFFVLQET